MGEVNKTNNRILIHQKSMVSQPTLSVPLASVYCMLCARPEVTPSESINIFISMSNLGEFIHFRTKPLFTIAWYFWTNFENACRVSTLIFVDIILWELTLEFTLSVETNDFTLCAQAWKFPQIQTQNNTWNYLILFSKQRCTILRRTAWDIQWKFCISLVFWKHLLVARYLDTMLKISPQCILVGLCIVLFHSVTDFCF